MDLPPGADGPSPGPTSYELSGPWEYPPAARREGREGRVRLRLSLDAQGRVVGAQVLKSSGFSDLDGAARRQSLGRQVNPLPSSITLDWDLEFRLSD